MFSIVKATNVLSANSYNLTAAPLVNMVFYYTYDAMGRIVSRKVPAKGTMSIIYDPFNRPVLTQDAVMAGNNQWNFVKYDVKGRTIESGVYTDANTGRTTVSGMQSYVSGLSYTTWYESRSGTLTNGGYYTSTVFPVAGTGITLTPLSYSYYDDYDMNFNGSADFSYSSQGLTGESSPTTAQLKGMPTMTSQATVGNGLTSTWLTKVTFYDKRGNPIQTQSNNHLYYTGQTTITDYATVVPDFMGVPQSTYITKKSSSTVTTQVLTTFAYDQMYRILNVSQAYNGGPTATVTKVAAYTYNELGQVVKKSLGYVNSTTWLQNVEMRFNIRGQLMSINNSTLTPDGGITMSTGNTNAVFGAAYTYDQTDANLGNTPWFNGKLSAVKWMSTDGSGTKTKERAFLYNYDGVNRYTASTYEERVTAGTGAFSNNVHGFDESGITYDLDGNIKTLKRNSFTQGTNSHVQIDSLVYTYSTSTIPDQLSKVTDGTSSNYTGAGFRNLTGTTTGTYSYDNNGNLTVDPYKGLNIQYDYLNRTDKITVTTATNRYIYYTYNATGQLIRKQQYDNAVLQTTTDYIDGFVYITQSGTTALSYFPMPEGRVVNTGSGGTVILTQEFVIADQQGNARVAFRNNSGAVQVYQENSYYAFGLIMPNSPVATPTIPNKQLYNGGSEWQNDYSNLPDYYQTYYRNYDAAIARWVGVDPMAEATESMTIYHYSGNNPIMFNDPLGNAFRTPAVAYASDSHYTPPNNSGSSIMSGGLPSDIAQSINNSFDDAFIQASGDYYSALAGEQGPTAQKAAEAARELLGQEQAGDIDIMQADQLTTKIFTAYMRGGSVTTNGSATYVEWYQNSSNPNPTSAINILGGVNILLHREKIADFDAINDNSGKLNAVMNEVGGLAEVVTGLGTEVFSGGLSTALVIDGFARIAGNSAKLLAYDSHHNRVGNAIPGNLGAAVGKLLDGSDFNTIGKGQAALGLTNDILLMISPFGDANAISDMVETRNLWNATALGASYYNGIVGLKGSCQDVKTAYGR